ncbi:hypothetical protein ANO11243_070820 [Dothideomycetidae sp. 11243]|nr:hypothetical protein ANO11243_070820 [fungal sp. No.11243]
MPQQQNVFVLLRTDYLDPTDSEGRNNLISVHATLESAKAALDMHIERHSAHLGLGKDPNTKRSDYEGGLHGRLVIVGQEEYHSFEIRIHDEELHGGSVVPDASESKAAGKGKAKSAVRPEKSIADTQTANGVDVHEPPKGNSDALARMKILVTGTLEGVTRKEVETLIESHGGEFVKGLHHGPDLVVLGVKAGPKKVDEIKEKGVRTVDQKGFYALILEGGKKTGKKRGASSAAEGKAKKGKK